MKHSINLLLIMSLMFQSTMVWAGDSTTCPNAVRLKVGDKVTDCERIGLSLTEDLTVRTNLEQGKINSQIIDTQADLIKQRATQLDDSQKETALYKDDSKKAWGEVDRLRSEGDTRLIIGIAAGVLATFLSARAWGWVK
jgi:hypothetical protein